MSPAQVLRAAADAGLLRTMTGVTVDEAAALLHAFLVKAGTIQGAQ